MNRKEITALVKLLDDPDTEISGHVESRLFNMGADIIPILESEWEISLNIVVQERIELIISNIQYASICNELKSWADLPSPGLFEGALLISKYRYPDLDVGYLNNLIDKIRLDVWLELNNDLSAFEKVKVLNHVFYNLYQFSPNLSNFHSPQNSFINSVIESRRGNPVSLSVIYQIVANRLGIPIYGVNLPQHFVLAYRDEKILSNLINSYTLPIHIPDSENGVIFYINVFNKGALLSLSNIEQFLKQLNLNAEERFITPCSNIDIIKRILRNLAFAYKKESDLKRMGQVLGLLKILGDSYFIDPTNPEDNNSDDEKD